MKFLYYYINFFIIILYMEYKYIKYKTKYLELINMDTNNQNGGGKKNNNSDKIIDFDEIVNFITNSKKFI